MNDGMEPAPRGRALKGVVIALIAAVVLLVAVVLPAERGYDPTGIGRILGLTAMRATPASGEDMPAIEDVTGGNDDLVAAAGADISEPMPLPNPAVHQKELTAPRTETLTITLGFDEKTEIKAVMAKAKAVVYDWSVEGGKVYVDFHGHDPAKDENFWVRYEEADGVTSGHGSLVAPFAGEHGWYWLNVSETPITIRLTVTGYHEKLMDYGLLR